MMLWVTGVWENKSMKFGPCSGWLSRKEWSWGCGDPEASPGLPYRFACGERCYRKAPPFPKAIVWRLGTKLPPYLWWDLSWHARLQNEKWKKHHWHATGVFTIFKRKLTQQYFKGYPGVSAFLKWWVLSLACGCYLESPSLLSQPHWDSWPGTLSPLYLLPLLCEWGFQNANMFLSVSSSCSLYRKR